MGPKQTRVRHGTEDRSSQSPKHPIGPVANPSLHRLPRNPPDGTQIEVQVPDIVRWSLFTAFNS